MEMSIGGFKAHVEALLVDPRGQTLHLASLVGSREATLAIHARLLKCEHALVQAEGQKDRLVRATGFDYRMAHNRLPGGRHHVLLAGKGLLEGAVLAARNQEELVRRHLRAWGERCEVPLHPSWAGWRWQTARANNLVHPLLGAGLEGCAVHYGPAMGELVRRAVLSGELTVDHPKLETLPLENKEVRDAA